MVHARDDRVPKASTQGKLRSAPRPLVKQDIHDERDDVSKHTVALASNLQLGPFLSPLLDQEHDLVKLLLRHLHRSLTESTQLLTSANLSLVPQPLRWILSNCQAQGSGMANGLTMHEEQPRQTWGPCCVPDLKGSPTVRFLAASAAFFTNSS